MHFNIRNKKPMLIAFAAFIQTSFCCTFISLAFVRHIPFEPTMFDGLVKTMLLAMGPILGLQMAFVIHTQLRKQEIKNAPTTKSYKK